MLKKTISYTNFNGEERTEDFFFHLSTPEITRMQIKFKGDIAEYAKKLQQAGDQDGMITFVEELMLSSYGEKTDDGKSFIKTKEVRTKFEYSQAYAELFEELLTSPQKAQQFGQGLVEGAKAPNSEAAKLIADHQAKKAGNVTSITE